MPIEINILKEFKKNTDLRQVWEQPGYMVRPWPKIKKLIKT